MRQSFHVGLLLSETGKIKTTHASKRNGGCWLDQMCLSIPSCVFVGLVDLIACWILHDPPYHRPHRPVFVPRRLLCHQYFLCVLDSCARWRLATMLMISREARFPLSLSAARRLRPPLRLEPVGSQENNEPDGEKTEFHTGVRVLF